ncbi:hypothetical protein [Herbaspirillum autotrophicum]|uniref:hypothetical protein n=1 Tax=Herbaspirillum autotrophicum TaxID=180195 RepID=UPI0012ED544D|nr:hypothetical protein [Herbaspirillum autotrophicum]
MHKMGLLRSNNKKFKNHFLHALCVLQVIDSKRLNNCFGFEHFIETRMGLDKKAVKSDLSTKLSTGFVDS